MMTNAMSLTVAIVIAVTIEVAVRFGKKRT
jgi:hypothetical protein